MATSSIFANVEIKDQKNAEMCVAALEKASKSKKRVPTKNVSAPLRDKGAIRALISKGLLK